MSNPSASELSPKRPRKGKTLRRVLFVTDNKTTIENLDNPLCQLNFNIEFAFYDGRTLANTPTTPPSAIVCDLKDHDKKSTDVVRVLKSHYGGEQIPVIGVLSKPKPLQQTVFDSVIVRPAHISQIVNRVKSYLRLNAMEREILLRKETLEQDFGQHVTIFDDNEYPPFRILFIGKANPAFIVIMNALQEKNVEVTAAFTSFSAFDYLHDNNFDAVVMNAIEEAEPALSITETMRRNSHLYHVPTLFMTKHESFQHYEAAHKKGAADIIDINADAYEISGRILELANYHRLHQHLKDEFQDLGNSTTLEASNKCYNRQFIEKHAERVLKASQISNQPVTFLGLKLLPQCSGDIDIDRINKALADVGKTLKNLVRLQDTVSYYAPDTYILMLSDTYETEANAIVERVKALLNCTAFESGTSQSPLTMDLQFSVMAVTHEETAKEAIKRVLSELIDIGSDINFRHSA